MFSLTPRVLVVGREVVFAPHDLCAMFDASLTTDTYLSVFWSNSLLSVNYFK